MSHDNQWNEKVARGRALVSEINEHKWELGDLANEVAPAGDHGTHNGNDSLLGEYAAAIGLSLRTLETYRQVSRAFPEGTRVPSQTWTAHRLLLGRQDRFEILAEETWTYNSLSERLGRLPNPSRVDIYTRPEPVREAPSAEQAIAAALASTTSTEALVNSPEAKRIVREAIAANPDVARVAMDALDKRYEDSPKPVGLPERDMQAAGVDLVSEFRRLHKGVDQIVQLVNEGKAVVSDDTRDAILREVKWLRTALGYIEDGVSSNSLAEEIAAFLGAEA